MVPSHFPLRDGLSWTYAVIEPFTCTLVTAELRPPVAIEVADMRTGDRRTERAWVLEQTSGHRRQYVVERDGGVEILRERRFGKPETTGIVVVEDLRWAGEPNWAHPTWHYTLETIRYRRVAEEEDVIVTAGAFRCIKILIDEGERGICWLAPEVGIVRSVGAIEGPTPTPYSVAELHSYTRTRA